MTIRHWGSVQTVNSSTAGNQSSPSIAHLTNGDLVVVWEDQSHPTGGRIMMQRFGPEGEPRGPETVVLVSVTTDLNPVVVALADGGFHVTFEEGSKLGTYTFDLNGSADGSSVNFSNSLDVAASGLGAGEGMIQAYEFGGNIWVTTFGADGVSFSDVRVNTTGADATVQSDPDIAVLQPPPSVAQASVVVWSDPLDGVRGRLVGADGKAVGAGDFLISAGTSLAGAKVAALENGGFVVTWTGGSLQASSSVDVYARLFNGVGAAEGAAFIVNGLTSGAQDFGDVVALQDGGFLALWFSTSEVRAQQFDAAGQRVGGEVFVGEASTVTSGSRELSAVLTADGRVAVTWQDANGDGPSDRGIRMQILDPRDGVIEGGAFTDDLLYGGGFEDQIFGRAGADRVYAGGGNDEVWGGAGLDQLEGEPGDDTLDGGDGGDGLYGGVGDDTLKGGTGNDHLQGSEGADFIDGGAGDQDQVLYYEKTGAVVLTLDGPDPVVVTIGGLAEDTIANVEDVMGGKGNDILTGDAKANGLNGRNGDDRISGGAGNDYLDGGDDGSAKKGLISSEDGGIDTVDYREKTVAVIVALNGTTAVQVKVGGVVEDQIRNFENVWGGAAGDVLTGDAKANTLVGYGGNDVLVGGAGKDVLIGGTGIDFADYRDKSVSVVLTLNGATNAPAVVGGLSEDAVREVEGVLGGSAADTLTGDGLSNVFRGGGGADVINGAAGVDVVDFRDKSSAVVLTLAGSANATAKVGGVNEDVVKNVEQVYGGAADDTLTGDVLANRLSGEGAADKLRGGGGADVLQGGAGLDHFIFGGLGDSTVTAAGRDTIIDFNHAQGDRIDLSLIDAITGGANNAFTLVGNFTGVAGQLRQIVSGTARIIEGDVNGDTTADFAIQVNTSVALVAADFVL